MHTRENVLQEWLEAYLQNKSFILKPLAGDASFRRYFRLQNQHNFLVIMDAPPEKENIEPFIRINKALAQAGILTPTIQAVNNEAGFLILDDLGDRLLLNSLSSENVNSYYQQALIILKNMQSISCADYGLPAFDQAFMVKEMHLFSEWFLDKYLQLSLSSQEEKLIKDAMHWLAEEIAQQPQTFIHRDYHSRNLMVTDKGLAVIDFQDAMVGPVTYDLVSLLKDCYISWPRNQVLTWVEFFYKNNSALQEKSLADCIRAFDLCGLQRHLKVLGIFTRLYLRDNKKGYLADLPLVLNYALECAESYKELHPFYHFLQERIALP